MSGIRGSKATASGRGIDASCALRQMAAHRSEARKASPKLMGVEDGPGHKESGEGALESPAKQEKAAAAQRKPKVGRSLQATRHWPLPEISTRQGPYALC